MNDNIGIKVSPVACLTRAKINNPLVGVMTQTYGRMIKAYEDSAIEGTKANHLIAIGTYSIVLRHEAIMNRILITSGKIERMPKIYRHKIKKGVNQAKKAAYDYDEVIQSAMKSDDDMFNTLESCLSEYEAAIKGDVAYLWNCIHDDLKSAGCKEPKLLADVELVNVMLKMAIKLQDNIERDNFLLRDRLRNLRYLDIHTAAHAWSIVVEGLDKHFNDFVVDLNASFLCNQAMNHLAKKMNDFEMIDEILSR